MGRNPGHEHFYGNAEWTTSVTVTAGTVTAADVGAQISGTNIPAGDTIAAFSRLHCYFGHGRVGVR
jgi:hypothetical protein